MDRNRTAPEPRSITDLWPWLCLLLVLFLVCFVRYRLLDMPLERDEGEYAYAGQLLQQGIPPYQITWNMKLPGTYFMYAIGMAAFGQNTAGIHYTLMVANGLTIIFLFLLGRKLFGPPAGVAACATFGILAVSPAVMGMAGHANHFVILFAVAATLLLWRGEEFYRWYVLFFSGVLYGLGFFMKQQGVCFCVFAFAAIIVNAIQNKKLFSFLLFKKFFFLALGMVLPLLLTCQYLQAAGVLSKFWFWTYTYAATYAHELTLREGIAKLFDYVHKKWIIYFGFLAFIIISLPFVMRDRAFRNQILFAAGFLFFSALGTAIDFNFREHYFILLLPALSLFVGLAVVALQFATETKLFKMVPPFICLLILAGSVYQQRQFFFQLPANAISRIIYTGDAPFVDMPAIGDYIREHSHASDTVAVVGSEPEIYFYSQRHSATGYIYMYPLMEQQPFASQMQRDMIGEIETNKPAFLVYVSNLDSWNIRPKSDRTILNWFPKFSGSYDKVAVLDESQPDKSRFLTGNAAENYQPAGSAHVDVFKRKP